MMVVIGRVDATHNSKHEIHGAQNTIRTSNAICTYETGRIQ